MRYIVSSLFFMALFFFSSPTHATLATKNSDTQNLNETDDVLFENDPIFEDSDPSAVVKELPLPQKEQEGISVMQAIEKRRTNRLVKGEALADQDLSNILWAAWGINSRNHHTAPTYLDTTLHIYVALPDGVWLYNPYKNLLKQVMAEPLINQYGLFPAELFYAIIPDDVSYMLIGSAYQNVALYCASNGLFTAIRGSRVPLLEEKFPMPKGFKLIVSQGVGLPR